MSDSHNRAVLRRGRRAIAGLVLTPFLALTSALAPEHLHQRDAEHSHPFIHSHFEVHDLATQAHDGAELVHGGEHVVWLESAVLHQMTYQFDPHPVVLGEAVGALPTDISWSATTFDKAAPPHGPPRRTPSLRGPPLFLA
jgi:hypothetical protein